MFKTSSRQWNIRYRGLIAARKNWTRAHIEARPSFWRVSTRKPKPGGVKFYCANMFHLHHYQGVNIDKMVMLEDIYEHRKAWVYKPENWSYVFEQITGIAADNLDGY